MLSLEEDSFDLLSLETVLFILEETLLVFAEFFEATLLPDLFCLESTFVAFLATNLEGFMDSFLLSLFFFSTVFVGFNDLEAILVVFLA